MNTFDLFLTMLAFILVLIGAFYNPPRVHLGWLGMAAYFLSLLVP